MNYIRLDRNGERQLICPSCGSPHRLEPGGPGRLTCRCRAVLEVLRMLDRPQTTPRGRWFIDASGAATRLT